MRKTFDLRKSKQLVQFYMETTFNCLKHRANIDIYVDLNNPKSGEAMKVNVKEKTGICSVEKKILVKFQQIGGILIPVPLKKTGILEI